MVIYELTTLHYPFDGMSSLQANQAIESGIRPSLCSEVSVQFTYFIINYFMYCRILIV